MNAGYRVQWAQGNRASEIACCLVSFLLRNDVTHGEIPILRSR